jgi:hypothetical protein
VAALHAELNATVLLYWDFGDIRSLQVAALKLSSHL